MTAAVLAALIAFNGAVAEAREALAPDARVFVATQPEDLGSSNFAGTKCDAEHGVLIVRASADLFVLSPEDLAEVRERGIDPETALNARIRFAAVHEVCHVAIHGRLLCEAASIPGAHITPARRAGLEAEANECAVRYLTGGAE